jgi:hypothetical protein
MRHIPLARALAWAGACAACASLGTVVRADEAYSLRRAYKAGESERLKTTIKMEADKGARKVEWRLLTTETTKEVKADGTVVLQAVVDAGSVAVDGVDKGYRLDGQVITTVYDGAGRILRQEAPGAQWPVGMLLTIARPNFTLAKMLKPGEAYREEIPTSPDKSRKIAVSTTLTGTEKKSADLPEDALRVKTVTDGTIAGPDGDQKTHAETVAYLTPAGRRLVKYDGMLEGMAVPGLGLCKISFQVVRLPDAPKAADKAQP